MSIRGKSRSWRERERERERGKQLTQLATPHSHPTRLARSSRPRSRSRNHLSFRINAFKRKHEGARKDRAATRIQVSFRGTLHNRNKERTRHDAATTVQRHYRKHSRRRELARREAAATKVQSMFRGLSLRREYVIEQRRREARLRKKELRERARRRSKRTQPNRSRNRVAFERIKAASPKQAEEMDGYNGDNKMMESKEQKNQKGQETKERQSRLQQRESECQGQLENTTKSGEKSIATARRMSSSLAAAALAEVLHKLEGQQILRAMEEKKEAEGSEHQIQNREGALARARRLSSSLAATALSRALRNFEEQQVSLVTKTLAASAHKDVVEEKKSEEVSEEVESTGKAKLQKEDNYDARVAKRREEVATRMSLDLVGEELAQAEVETATCAKKEWIKQEECAARRASVALVDEALQEAVVQSVAKETRRARVAIYTAANACAARLVDESLRLVISRNIRNYAKLVVKAATRRSSVLLDDLLSKGAAAQGGRENRVQGTHVQCQEGENLSDKRAQHEEEVDEKALRIENAKARVSKKSSAKPTLGRKPSRNRAVYDEQKAKAQARRLSVGITADAISQAVGTIEEISHKGR